MAIEVGCFSVNEKHSFLGISLRAAGSTSPFEWGFECNRLLTSWDRSSQPTDARATVLVCIAVAVPYWASRPRFELTKAKSVRYLFPMFGTRGAHIAVIAEHEHHIEAQRLALRGRSETCVRDSRVRHSSG